MNIIKNEDIVSAKLFIKNILSQTIENPNNPDSLSFFQSDTYRFYFLICFMLEYFENQ